MSGYWGENEQSPSKEELLRQEYPDLEEKWIAYLNLKSIFVDVNKELFDFGIIKRLFNSKEYNRVHSNWEKAKTLYEDALKDYTILEKLLREY